MTEDLKISAFVSWTLEDEYVSGYKAFGQGSVIASDTAISSSRWASFENVDGENRRNIVAGQVRVDKTWGAIGTLTAITSYRTLRASHVDDGDSGPVLANIDSVNASKEFKFREELRLTSPTGRRFEYVAGSYYSLENLEKDVTVGVNGLDPNYCLSVLTHGLLDIQTAVGDVHVKSYAPYAEGKFHFTDHIGSSPFYGLTPFLVTFGHTWSDFTPRAILEFKPRDGLLFYGSVSTGFKGGGWDLASTTPAAAQTPLQPETSTSYEVGAKLRLFENRLSFDLAVYEADTKNLQVRSLVGTVLTDTNAGGERARGVEVESVLRPFHGAQVGVNYAGSCASRPSPPTRRARRRARRSITATRTSMDRRPRPFRSFQAP